MSSGDLQEMEVGTKQSKTAVNAGAKPADSMDTSIAGSYEDLGGPTPENYKPDDDSAKLKTPGGTLKGVKDVVTKGAKAAEPMKGIKEDEILEDEETIEEEETSTEEVVAEQEEVEEVDIEEDVNALLGGEELSEEFREKAKIIFEAALKSKVAEVTESLEQKYAAKLDEQVAEAKEELAERVDSYLEYVSDEWFQENALVIEHALKTEMTESFLQGMRGLFEEHYVSIPDDKYDVVESMVEKLDDMETKLNEQIEKNISLNKRLAESVADGILDQVSEGLAVTQKEKLASLSESVEFESEESYREKLETLKESYFASKKESSVAKSETLSEGVDNAAPESYSNSMSAYLRTLGSTLQN
ncbi:head scaffolding protein [Synechococcus phage S-SM2]|uniref:Scaffold prohead core protein n=1 Tax=Synechococcus phage S-SM2 TaxID=444860 RepID=E3SJ12_9CAUD|nr:head scaffolding protein [Synechococcus phage S-SM2]ADO97460.1 scaffold prohead core protein [Synechococcus phage S-SM2]